MNITVLLILALVAYNCVFANEDELKIKIDKGIIRGAYRKSMKGRQILAFTGIPFAKPPVRELRFKPPVEPEAWSGILDATKPHPICPQMDPYFNNYEVKGNEDCLYLNVYKPQITQSKGKLLPVLFHIYAGGFTSGNANPDVYGPDILLDKDVILVSPNSRIGLLGFLSTGDEIVPGNNGLKDQTFALEWTRKNIIDFGGDPNKVTIFGGSSGAGCVHLHVVSPLSRGLFNSAIAHSGSATALWSVAPEGEQEKNIKKLGKLLNCPIDTIANAVECLRKVDAYDIVDQDKEFMEFSIDPETPFKPVIEPDLEGAFIRKHPIDIIKSGETSNVTLVFGITTEDGAFKPSMFFNDSKLIERLNEDFDYVVPLSLLYDTTATEGDKNYITSRIKEFYFKNKQIDETMIRQLTHLYTDSYFFYPQNLAARLHVKYTNTRIYYFVFGYKGSLTLIPFFGDATRDYGVCHGDDINYILSNEFYGDYKPTESDQKIIDLLTTMWVNIADTGIPTPRLDDVVKTKWLPIEKEDKLLYYFIKNENEAEMVENIYLERTQFWEKLPLYSKQKNIKTEL
ncbi:hypothetical protein ILUMI_13204 [Ignelater luminosus]|uniref:Carboxylic ester hydrolase n=1 Tax=Ignelater luminosus TaxID=2038154 RepID=A0A8K0CST5_IGNLU|nr:hypothetical protein ILUMI_13204 [Ignelater luminosus]